MKSRLSPISPRSTVHGRQSTGRFCGLWSVDRGLMFFVTIAALSTLTVASARPQYESVCIRNACVRAEIADTPESRRQGLMFRERLYEKEGMLFIFDREERQSFWMKNMKFPLDIIWISADKRIVSMAERLQPCGNIACESVRPPSKAKFVLEVRAGFARQYGITPGDFVTF